MLWADFTCCFAPYNSYISRTKKLEIRNGLIIAMKLSKLGSKKLVAIGLVITALGIIFTLQSESVIGPTSSFMYSEPSWTINGYIIISIGLGVIIVSAIVRYHYSS
jgi:hypothetical protein